MGSGNWFFNTDEAEAEGRGAYRQMLVKSCVAVWRFKDSRDPRQVLSRPSAGERVFLYLKKIGFIATGIFAGDDVVPDESIFGPGAPEAFSRKLVDLVSVPKSRAVTLAELKQMKGRLNYRSTLCQIRDEETVTNLFKTIMSRATKQ